MESMEAEVDNATKQLIKDPQVSTKDIWHFIKGFHKSPKIPPSISDPKSISTRKIKNVIGDYSNSLRPLFMEANREFEYNEIHRWMHWHELKERRDHNTQWYENQMKESAAIQEQNKKGEATRSVNVTFSEPIAIDPCNDLMAGGCAASETPERLLKLQGLATSKVKSPKPFPISTPTKPFSSLIAKSSSPSINVVA